MVTPENLYTVLMALKDAGVTRAKIGDCEFHFAPEAPPSPAGIEVVEVKPAAPQYQDTHAPEIKRSGYSSLFPQVPRFSPAEE